MLVRFISITTPAIDDCKTAEELIMYCARVSSDNQNSKDTDLLKYLIRHKHFSPFEMASMCVEITTSRAIAPQILRHKSFSFQEFSQRYACVTEFEPIELRYQGDSKQGSDEVIRNINLYYLLEQVYRSECIYKELITEGVSRETARMVLPLCTQTKLYMSGTVRSWIHYLNTRLKSDTQKEHRLIAVEISKIFAEQFPIINSIL